jgi:D-arginine dehydrogenase
MSVGSAHRLPASTRFVIIGAGFAGASTAWALGRAGLGPGVVLEQELSYGVHASGRNAGLLKLGEDDAFVRTLAVRSQAALGRLNQRGDPFLRRTGGLSLATGAGAEHLAAACAGLEASHVEASLLSAPQARLRLPLLDGVSFDAALWCAHEGIVDVHALLTLYLRLGREAGFTLHIDTPARSLIVERGRVAGVDTPEGQVRAEVVIDASGAWAGRLGPPALRLPLQPKRRHLFVSGPVALVNREMPFVWVEDAAFYFKPEGDGLLLSPCDETPMDPCVPPTDPAAAELLADKLTRHAHGLADMAIRRSWACLRTFAPDRRPIIGFDPGLPGLFHVSGLGGFGMMTSAAVGELAATLLMLHTPDWIDASAASPSRPSARPGGLK